MPDRESNPSAGFVAPWSRVAILLLALGIGAGLSWRLTGSIVPTEPGASMVFQSGLFLVVLGSAVLEHKFTRPGDSVVNALAGMVTLITVYEVAPRLGWWMIFLYCLVVFALALACTVVSTGPDITGWKKKVADRTYQPAVYLGSARLLQSVVFLFGVYAFYQTRSDAAALLVVFWGLFVVLWPLRLPQLLSRLGSRAGTREALGRVVRREWPDLVRVELKPGTRWTQEKPFVYQDADGDQHVAVPLYKQLRDQQAIATALSVRYTEERVEGLKGGFIYEIPQSAIPSEVEINQSMGATKGSTLIGFVVEESRIGTIRFETWRPALCREGLLVSCSVSGSRVFYQITEGLTREEALESDRLGSQVAVAAQMGVLDSTRGFVKADWLPSMNAPVFAESELFGKDLDNVPAPDFVYGTIPGTSLRVGGPFADVFDFHTAILGVTGSGKTELAFDLIRYCVKAGLKVVCIDLTARYEGKLQDLNPQDLSLSADTTKELAEKLFEVETGEFKAGKEKKALKATREALHSDVSSTIEEFLTADGEDQRVGLITLDEISNTDATLFVTELYLTCLLNFAKDNPQTCPRTLIVVEEAHTVMPETSTMGVAGFESKGLVSKTSQIALQGRKYGVGLLIVAQRTATVTKNVLTQCNTVIALNSFDETTTGFLANVYGREHADVLRDLPALQAVVFGKGVRSERPVIVEIPYDPKKDAAVHSETAPDEEGTSD